MGLEKETLEAFAECNKAIQRLKDVLKNIDLSKLSKLPTFPTRKTDQKEVAIP